MARMRISTTVDGDLLARARAIDPDWTDARLVEEAFHAILDRYRRAEIDRAYEHAYVRQPLDEPDEWGDLASFGDAVRAATRSGGSDVA